MKNKKVLIIVLCIVIAIILIITGIVVYINVIKPRNEAIAQYDEAVKVIDNQNKELDSKISRIQQLIDSNEKVIYDSIIEEAKEVNKKAYSQKFIVGKMPDSTDEIIKETEKLKEPIDYTAIYKELDDMVEKYETSIKQYKQLINPSEEFVIKRLQTIDEISDVRAVTEDHDPNGKLNKPGGYTATVYFESKNVDKSKVYGNDLIDKGTDAGGAIEVYVNEEDAVKREKYLATFDGTIIASGSHRVVATVLIRTSDKLPASKQKELEQKVLDALIEIE